MAAAGQTRIVRAEDVAHMGITEVIRHAPFIYRQYRKLVRSIHQHPPAAAVLIDFPDVNFRLAKHLKRLNIPVIWFVSPQLWAWKRRRLRWVQQRVSRMLVIFPFEQSFYRNRHVDATFVGHPLAELPLPSISREAYAAHYNLDPAKPWIALLPGSRWREIESNLPTMVEMACRFPQNAEYILPVASTIDRARLADFTAGWITHYPSSLSPSSLFPALHPPRRRRPRSPPPRPRLHRRQRHRHRPGHAHRQSLRRRLPRLAPHLQAGQIPRLVPARGLAHRGRHRP